MQKKVAESLGTTVTAVTALMMFQNCQNMDRQGIKVKMIN
jgi:low affinity Fe/Cu permease